MATPWKHTRGGWYVDISLPSQRVLKLYLGKVTKAQAATIANHVETLKLSNHRGVAPPRDTADWVERIDRKFADKLRDAGLIRQSSVRCDWKLGAWFDHYIKSRTDIQPNTVKGFKTARKATVKALGDRVLSDITVADAKQFARDMSSFYSSEHASKIVERAKQAFSMAVDARILSENPFATVALSSKPDKSRQHYIDSATYKAVLEKCKHQEARALFALARYCGLRIPHEPLALTWADVDWVLGRITVPEKTKTGFRQLPLFHEAKIELAKLWSPEKGGNDPVLTLARKSAGTTWRGWLEHAIKQAGVTQWEKLFINLRSSCRTDLQKKFPNHVCNAWLGHSTRVADQHYLQVTPDDWQIAAAHGGATIAHGEAHGDERGKPTKTGGSAGA
jgi:hypothetical protein